MAAIGSCGSETEGKSDDRTQVLQLFPIELWENILQNVKDAKTYNSISIASPFLATLLHPFTTKILFSQVMKILFEHQESESWQSWIHTRQVCQAWRDGLDCVLQTQEYFLQQEDEFINEISGMSFHGNCCCNFNSSQDFVKFEEDFDCSHLTVNKNPIPSRKVHLAFALPEGYNNEELHEFVLYYNSCAYFLDKYGSHIRNLIVAQNVEHLPTQIKFYDMCLPQILKLVPNLEGFQIEGELLDDLNTSLQSCDVVPSLPRLEYLSLVGMPAVVAKILIAKNPQLKLLDAPENATVATDFLPRLTMLRVLRVSVENREEFEALSSAQLVSRVESLWLDTYCLEGISRRQILQVLENLFSKSLIELHLSLPEPTYEELNSDYHLKLLHLKRIHLEMVHPEPVYFLERLNHTLEEIRVTTHRAFFSCLGKSNIKYFFPKLRLFSTKTLAEREGSPVAWKEDFEDIIYLLSAIFLRGEFRLVYRLFYLPLKAWLTQSVRSFFGAR